MALSILAASMLLCATVPTHFGLAVSGDVPLGSIPADGVSYSQAGSNVVNIVSNTAEPWHADVQLSGDVPGVVLEYREPEHPDFTRLTTVRRTFAARRLDPQTPPEGADRTLTYRARTDGTLPVGARVRWTVTYTLAQSP